MFDNDVDDLAVFLDSLHARLNETFVWRDIQRLETRKDLLVNRPVNLDAIGFDKVLSCFEVSLGLDALNFPELLTENAA